MAKIGPCVAAALKDLGVYSRNAREETAAGYIEVSKFDFRRRVPQDTQTVITRILNSTVLDLRAVDEIAGQRIKPGVTRAVQRLAEIQAANPVPTDAARAEFQAVMDKLFAWLQGEAVVS